MKKIILLVIFFSISIDASHSQGKSPEIINTAYLNLRITELKFPTPQRGQGGAIAVVDNNIILGRSENSFAKLNTETMQYEENFLPPLLTGEGDLKQSRRYTHQELLPRVEDVIFNNGTYYVSYTIYSKSEDFIYFVISKIDAAKRDFWIPIYKSPGLNAPYYTMGRGGKMAMRGMKLFFSVGDFSLDRVNGLDSDIAPQNPALPWGKVNYINLQDGSFHPYTLGHRNPQGLVFLQDGRLLAAEHGPQGGDELNILVEGGNYGWPFESFGTVYGSFIEYKDKLPKPVKSNFLKPIYAFVPSPAITQVIQVADFDPKWKGDLLIGSLKAQTIFHMRMDGDHVVYCEPINIGHRIRDLKQLGNAFYVLTDQGSILKIEKNPFP